MIHGIGVDLIEISRIKKAAENAAFLRRVFTDEEIALFNSRNKDIAILAGNFAAKEAVAKALGTGFKGFWPKEIEILRNELGAPKAKLYGKAADLATEFGVTAVHVSITNTKEHATAFAVLEKQ